MLSGQNEFQKNQIPFPFPLSVPVPVPAFSVFQLPSREGEVAVASLKVVAILVYWLYSER